MKPQWLKGFAAFGVLSLAGWFVLGIGLWRLTHSPVHKPLPRSPPIQVSPVAEQIAMRFAPDLQTLATEHKEEWIAASGGSFTRLAVRTVYPAGVKAIPYATQVICDRALSYLDQLSVSEMIRLMADHARSKGHTVHPSVARQAGLH